MSDLEKNSDIMTFVESITDIEYLQFLVVKIQTQITRLSLNENKLLNFCPVESHAAIAHIIRTGGAENSRTFEHILAFCLKMERAHNLKGQDELKDYSLTKSTNGPCCTNDLCGHIFLSPHKTFKGIDLVIFQPQEIGSAIISKIVYIQVKHGVSDIGLQTNAKNANEKFMKSSNYLLQTIRNKMTEGRYKFQHTYNEYLFDLPYEYHLYTTMPLKPLAKDSLVDGKYIPESFGTEMVVHGRDEIWNITKKYVRHLLGNNCGMFRNVDI